MPDRAGRSHQHNPDAKSATGNDTSGDGQPAARLGRCELAAAQTFAYKTPFPGVADTRYQQATLVSDSGFAE